MSDKPREKLWPTDKVLRELHPEKGPGVPYVKVTIRLIQEFELFNTRPYHNYETWSDGWEISGPAVTARAEDLDVAIHRYADALRVSKEKRS